jgi:O-antigen/teichoic acid export membrane protein
MILGVVQGTTLVAVYAIAMNFIALYMQVSNAFSGLFLPKASIMVAKNASNQEFSSLMAKFGRIQSMILLLILSGFILFGQRFIELWAGINYSEAYKYVLIILIPLTIPLIQNLGLSILQAKNLYTFRTITYLLIAIINIIVTIPLALKFGGYGAAISTAVSVIVGHIIIMNIYYHRKVGIDITYFWKQLSPLLIVFLISLVLGYVVNLLLVNDTILIYILKITIFIIIYFALMWFIGLNKYEKELIQNVINKYRKH